MYNKGFKDLRIQMDEIIKKHLTKMIEEDKKAKKRRAKHES